MLHWFVSRTVRHALAMARHVQKLLDHQRDILSPQAVESVQSAISELRAAVAAKAPKDEIEKRAENLEAVANKWLKPYPNAVWRENVEVLLVALTVAMGIRTFFLQPFKIPTGSMQPTLFGVESQNLLRYPDFKIPTGWPRVREWFAGVSYLRVVADNDGPVNSVEAPKRFLIFNIKQTLYIGGKPYTLWFPPDYGQAPLETRADLQPDRIYHPGEDVINLRVTAGDHLFVDRFTYNFKAPERGEIIVFETKGIPEEQRFRWRIPGDQFYIKRLVALDNEKVQVGDDRHLVINDKRLDASTPHFHSVYSFDPKQPPRVSRYSGHVNEKVHLQYYPNDPNQLAPNFPDGAAVYRTPPGRFMVMGDNTMNSLDSRCWGDFPASAVIGKSFFVYWPITDRFGWGYYR
jgi:signal peptidase I